MICRKQGVIDGIKRLNCCLLLCLLHYVVECVYTYVVVSVRIVVDVCYM